MEIYPEKLIYLCVARGTNPVVNETLKQQIKMKRQLLSKEQIKAARKALDTINTLRCKIDFMESIEDHDDSTDGLAYAAHNAWYEMGDAAYELIDLLDRIEKFQNN